ncbi:lipoprotein [Rhodovulum sp. NI22]|nr:lipoprotein [Rhodovulum sp. NI22]
MTQVNFIFAGLAAAMLASGAQAAEIGAEALASLPPVDVVVLGEVHDNPVHHENQARAVSALTPRALVFEMLTPAQAARATPAARGEAAALEAALGWADSGWPDFALYYPIFAAAPEAAVYGGGLPRGDVRRAIAEGAAAVFGDDAAAFGLAAPLPEDEQALRDEGQQAAHCNALPAEMLPGMVEAQRLRDAALARAVVQALAENGGPVAVITGNGHARKDWGLPAALAVAAPDMTLLSIGQFEEAPEDDPPFDRWLITAPAERDDPCAGFSMQ